MLNRIALLSAIVLSIGVLAPLAEAKPDYSPPPANDSITLRPGKYFWWGEGRTQQGQQQSLYCTRGGCSGYQYRDNSTYSDAKPVKYRPSYGR